MVRKSMRGGSPASRLVMSHVKTANVRCNERFTGASNTHDVSGGDFYATTGGAYKKKRVKRRSSNKGSKKRKKSKSKKINFRKMSLAFGKKKPGSKKRKSKGSKKRGGANEITGPVFV